MKKGHKEKGHKEIILFILVAGILIYHSMNVFSDPVGTSITIGESSRRSAASNASNATAVAGNVTLITVDMTQITGIWQGYYGSVTGGIVLENAGGQTFYDWNLVDAVGEIVATRNTVSDWSNINCTNQTQIYDEEALLNITNTTSDRINDTFTNISHPSFSIASRTMSNCRATRTYNSTTSQSVFWNVLLSTNETNVVYTVIMDNDVIGFNGTIVDFQLLVPVNKDSGEATYFFYVELD
ncbi:hypothetical protein JXB41_08660 [Candidatus Woesearchaeota archaeon]|nr:hypothetical protein [Candidatus Woesearchaeota archaeon]